LWRNLLVPTAVYATTEALLPALRARKFAGIDRVLGLSYSIDTFGAIMNTLDPIEAPWDEYGYILYHGMSMHQSRQGDKIRLERTGPDIFPITFPGTGDIVVTDSFKRHWSESGLSGATFREIIKHHIVDLDWERWDTSAEEPPELPDSGEPEDFILDRPHSSSAASALGQLWELIPSDDSKKDIFYRNGTKITCLSERADIWFIRHYGDFVAVNKRN
jgi:hypothetical protein